ncbi:flagellin [Rhizobium sp. P32RR-XVIII]|uniref:flagellin N-terminal helical domain-containing protein n=1 Tax=Rhizobium sp. P32RR-XVIII TaxID=2726738 RepID=UPI001457933C|nr:flagellin [Rhizobium sp. P32RR-XVIII]
MSSINTNYSAIAALQTLRSVNSDWENTQQHVSSGLRVQTASDNAAYWSIATTMRSDSGAISAVQDALGLGAAKVDTAYAGTDAIVDILSRFKERLVAATEDGVDKTKIQAELSQLNQQAESVVNSASFSGVNWLKTSSPTHLSDRGILPGSVVSSFVRSDSGTVAVKTMSIDLKDTSMLNLGGGGILQKDVMDVGEIGGFQGTSFTTDAHNGHEVHTFTGPAAFSVTDYITFDLVVDAGSHSAGTTKSGLRIDKSVIDATLGTTDGTINNAIEMRKVLARAFNDNSVPAWVFTPPGFTSFTSDTDPTLFEIGSLETSGHPGSSISIANVTSDFGGVFPSGFGLGLEAAPVANHDNMYPKSPVNFTDPFTLIGSTKIKFDVQIGAGPIQTVTITRATVDAALGTSDGYVGNFHDLAAVIAYASAGTGLTASSTDAENPGRVTLLADENIYPDAGRRAPSISVRNVRTVTDGKLEFDLAEIDVTSSKFTIDEYIKGVDYMLQRSISSASALGSLKNRIDMQADFTSKLMDSIGSGVGKLVDADMEEESSKLSALQTQQ